MKIQQITQEPIKKYLSFLNELKMSGKKKLIESLQTLNEDQLLDLLVNQEIGSLNINYRPIYNIKRINLEENIKKNFYKFLRKNNNITTTEKYHIFTINHQQSLITYFISKASENNYNSQGNFLVQTNNHKIVRSGCPILKTITNNQNIELEFDIFSEKDNYFDFLNNLNQKDNINTLKILCGPWQNLTENKAVKNYIEAHLKPIIPEIERSLINHQIAKIPKNKVINNHKI